MANQISGVIIAVKERPFQKRDGSMGRIVEYVLDASRYNPQTGEKYESYPSVDVSERNLEKMPRMTPGMRVKFDFELSGRYYSDKQTGELRHMNSVSAYRAEVLATQAAAQPQGAAQPMGMQQPQGTGYPQQGAMQQQPQGYQHSMPFPPSDEAPWWEEMKVKS